MIDILNLYLGLVMEPYVLTLLVTLEQEDAIQKLFGRQGWKYEKLGMFLQSKTVYLCALFSWMISAFGKDVTSLTERKVS